MQIVLPGDSILLSWDVHGMYLGTLSKQCGLVLLESSGLAALSVKCDIDVV